MILQSDYLSSWESSSYSGLCSTGRLLVRASQIVTWNSKWLEFRFSSYVEEVKRMMKLSDLVTLCAGVQEALLDGELQQVVVLVPHWLAAAWPEGGVIHRGLEHRGVHLTEEGRGWVTFENVLLKRLKAGRFFFFFFVYMLEPHTHTHTQNHQLCRSPPDCARLQNWPARRSRTGCWTSLLRSTRGTGESLENSQV